jgi:hypothetical protein
MLKQACERKPLSEMTRAQANKFKHMDKMQERLNKNIQQNIFPYWRNHQSLKGKLNNCNYPL